MLGRWVGAGCGGHVGSSGREYNGTLRLTRRKSQAAYTSRFSIQ